MLHVRPTFAVGGANEKTINLGEKRDEVIIQAIAGWLCSLKLCAMVARTVAHLGGFDSG
jgi:hypothetical protein